MKFSVIMLCSLTLEAIAVSSIENELDFFSGPESFVKNDTLVFASCQKSTESFEKVCVIHKYSNIFDTISSTSCPAILESQRRDYVVESKIKITPFGETKAIVKWFEKINRGSTAQLSFIKFTIIEFGDCSRRDFETSTSLRYYHDSDDFLREVHLATNETDNTFLAVYSNTGKYDNHVCKLRFDVENNEVTKTARWFFLDDSLIETFVALKRGDTKFRFLVGSKYTSNSNPQVRIVDESGSRVDLNIYTEFKSKLIHSIDNNFISICYYVNSSFSCGRFTYDGKAEMKRRFRLKWEIESAAVHYVPRIGLLVFTYSNSESCKDSEILEHITFINDHGVVESFDLQCRLSNFSMPLTFYNDKNEYCLFEYTFDTESGIQLSKRLRCFPIQSTANILTDISEILNTANNK